METKGASAGEGGGVTDDELLEFAAKAAGIWDAKNNCIDIPWNALTNNGDALWLAVKLRIHITMSSYANVVCRQGDEFRSIEPYGDDPWAATRRAIVRAAAAIGRASHG